MCLFLCNCVGWWWWGGEKGLSVSVLVICLKKKKKSSERQSYDSSAQTGGTSKHWLTCCGSPSVKGSLVATWNMISLPWKEVKTASLPVWPWQTSSPPLNLQKGSEEKKSCDFTQLHLSTLRHTLPGEALQLNRLSQNGQELFKLFTFVIVTEYVLLCELGRDGLCLRGSSYDMAQYFSHFNKNAGRCEVKHQSFTCPSFWYKTPNLKLGDTLCSSNAVMSSGAWGMRKGDQLWEDLSKIHGLYLFIIHFTFR